MKDEFKPYEKVLTRDNEYDTWKCDLFSHSETIDGHTMYCGIGGRYSKECIPFDGNEMLRGTNKLQWDDLPVGTPVIANDGEGRLWFQAIYFGDGEIKLLGNEDAGFYKWPYEIPNEKFDANDVERSKRFNIRKFI